MRSLRMWLAALASGAVLAACAHSDQTTAPQAPSPSLVLRPGVTVLDSVPTNTQVKISLGLADVAWEGSQIAVLIEDSCQPLVLLSNDLGATWTPHRLTYEPGCGLELPQLQLHLHNGHVTLIATQQATYPFYQFQEVDLVTNTYTASPGGIRWGYLQYTGDKITSYDNSGPFSANGAMTDAYRFFSYSVTAKAVTFTGGQYPAPATDCAGYPWASPDGVSFTAFCYGTLSVNGATYLMHCEILVNTAVSLVPSNNCVPAPQWPPYFTDTLSRPLPFFPFYAGTVLANGYQSGGQVYLARHPPSGTVVPAPIAIGSGGNPGNYYHTVLGSSHRRYADLIPVDQPPSGGAQRLVRVTASGAATNVPIPLTACPGGRFCSGAGGVTAWFYGQVTWLVPLGNDDYLVFYAFYRGDDPTTNIPDILCVSREHVPPTAL